jgi:hypothetical protein
MMMSYGGEGGADDDADRHVHDIAAKRKFLEFFQHRFSSQDFQDLIASASSLPCLGANPNRAGKEAWISGFPICNGSPNWYMRGRRALLREGLRCRNSPDAIVTAGRRSFLWSPP